MNIVFRVDSSLEIGTGHLMRCLTLATALKAAGAKCSFICRNHSGNLISLVQEQGFSVEILPLSSAGLSSSSGFSNSSSPQHFTSGAANTRRKKLAHAHWLGASQAEDAAACIQLLQKKTQPAVDWLVVDSYALDAEWEKLLRPYVGQILVIDDLADRAHACDLLLDQNLGRTAADYQHLVPPPCQVLAGLEYALLRPEFLEWRKFSLERRAQPKPLKSILISLGGVDKDNYSQQVLACLQQLNLDSKISITVILGATSPHLKSVQNFALQMSNSTQVLSGVNDMAQLLAKTDLAIGAAGSSAWERCCLGVPTIMLVLAANQRQAAKKIAALEAAIYAPNPEEAALSVAKLAQEPSLLTGLTKRSQNLVAGSGALKLARLMLAR